MWVLLFLCLAQSQAMDIDSTRKTMPLRIVFFQETNHLRPGLDFFDQPLHPGIMIGTEWKLNQHPRRDVFLAANVGGYYHRWLSAGAFVQGEIGFRYGFPFGLSLEARAGLGYLHSFYPGEVYAYDESLGRYAEDSNTGYPSLLPSLGVALGYRLHRSPQAPVLQVLYQYAPELPFSYAGLHQFLGFGITFYPFSH